MDKVTERLAGIRERFKEFRDSDTYNQICDSTYSVEEGELDIAAAFADSESERVLLEAAKAVCDMCADEGLPIFSDELKTYVHPEPEKIRVGWVCHAAAIHDLRSKGESR